MSTKNNRPAYDVIVVGGTEQKPQWIRVGAAFTRAKGGYVVAIDALPTNGKLILFPPKPKDSPLDG